LLASALGYIGHKVFTKTAEEIIPVLKNLAEESFSALEDAIDTIVNSPL